MYRREDLFFRDQSMEVYLLNSTWFCQNLRFRALALGWFPLLVGNPLGCVVEQTRIPFFTCIPGL